MTDGITDREEHLCRIAGQEGAKEFLKNMGADVDNLKEAQQDFAFMRRMRTMRDKGAIMFLVTLVGLMVTGAGTLLWDKITG